ncbi:LOW QUALITY PROTEIN: hypothetical protein HID58_055419, partial [Brassica napus]
TAKKGVLFSIGVSCYLLNLIVTGREEIHKIVDLRNDIIRICGNIEKLLEFHNDELRRKQQVPLFGQQELNFPIAQNLLLITITLHSSWRHLCVLDMTVFKTLRGNKILEGEMDQLEAELQTEFDLLHIIPSSRISRAFDTEVCKLTNVPAADVSHQQVGDAQDPTRKRHLEKAFGTVQNHWRNNKESGEATRAHGEKTKKEIKEQQTALEEAKKGFIEAEASWWKDTAYILYIASEHIPIVHRQQRSFVASSSDLCRSSSLKSMTLR